MKKLILLFLIGLMLLSAFTYTVFAQDEITVVVNGEKLVSDVPAQTMKVFDDEGAYVGDRTMLPIRAISEKLNCDVFWNEETEGILMYRKGFLYLMWLGKDTAFQFDGAMIPNAYKMDIAPLTVDGRTLVPVRVVAEILGAEVNWVEETNTVEIKYELGELEENTGVAEKCVIYESILARGYEVISSYKEGSLASVTGKIVLENGKEMEFKLYPEIASETCKQFISLAKNGEFDGTIFHRVIKDFVAQGGGLDKEGNPRQANPIYGEFAANGVLNVISHKRGTLSYARTNDPNSGSNQFFICHQDTPHLNGFYAAFGELTSGLDVLDEICNVETDENDKPKTDIVVKTVIINE